MDGVSNNTRMEFHLATMRIFELIKKKMELSHEIEKNYPSDAPEALSNTYIELENVLNDSIKAEAKFLVGLE